MSATSRSWARFAGLAAGVACWAVSTQTSEIVAFLDCDRQRAILAPLGLALVVISAAGAFASLFAVRSSVEEPWFDLIGGRADRFLAVISFVAGLLFAVVIASQLAATVIIERCSR